MAALAAALVVPSSSFPATTIGSNLVAAPGPTLGCGTTCTYSNASLPAGSTASGGLFAPSSGVVVR